MKGNFFCAQSNRQKAKLQVEIKNVCDFYSELPGLKMTGFKGKKRLSQERNVLQKVVWTFVEDS